eukprot:12419576-Ditylum_brightwellii.AAC.1
MVNASGNLKFSKGQVTYLKRLIKQVQYLDDVDLEKSDTDQLLSSLNVSFSGRELSMIRELCVTQRKSIECQEKYKIIVGTSWILKPLHQLSKSYGEVILIDATECTNKEERPL